MMREMLLLVLLATSSMLHSQDSISFKHWNLIEIKIDSNGMLRWITFDEREVITIDVEQLRWNKWIKIGEVPGKGGDTNYYEFKVTPHEGINQFRVTYEDKRDNTSKWRQCKSYIVKYKSSIPPVKRIPRKVRDSIWFTDTTMYEIYDAYGNEVLKGRAKSISVKKLKRGTYVILWDNTMDKFIKK